MPPAGTETEKPNRWSHVIKAMPVLDFLLVPGCCSGTDFTDNHINVYSLFNFGSL
jgi:hypothetical protein